MTYIDDLRVNEVTAIPLPALGVNETPEPPPLEHGLIHRLVFYRGKESDD
jgi:hypothetical protein